MIRLNFSIDGFDSHYIRRLQRHLNTIEPSNSGLEGDEGVMSGEEGVRVPTCGSISLYDLGSLFSGYFHDMVSVHS